MSNVRQYLPLISRPSKEQAPVLNEFLDGADEIVSQLEQYAEYAQNQFFFTTADAEYVFKLAARNGFYLPRDTGINVEGIKPLAPLMINQPKTTLAQLNQILEIYFSQILSRPNIISSQAEPYRLKENDDLIVKTRETEHRLTIDTAMFSNLKNISASELATYINSVQDHYVATTYYDKVVNKNKIRIIANGNGPNEIIQVTGGTLQNILLFPNVIPTTNTVQTRWTISKVADYSDIITFTYQDGPPPSVFLTKVGDIVTIRNQFDVGISGATILPVLDIFGNDVIDNNGNLVTVSVNLIQGNYSVLNGTYEIIEMGYNYFKIRNKYLRLPINNQGELLQLSIRDVIFTENIPHRVYEQASFSFLTEMTDDELVFTVPAVPPIVKRFLQGAWHIYGIKHQVLDFSRNSITISTATSVQFPPQGVQFVLESSMLTVDYSQKKYKILNSNSSSGLLILDITDSCALLPHTSPVLIGTTNPFFCDFESNIVEIDFGYRHGLIQSSKIIINSAANNSASSIVMNGSWFVEKILSPTKISIKINQKNIASPSSSTAILYSLGDKKYRLQFPSASALNLSKLNFINKKFKLYEDGTANIFNSYAWQQLKTKNYMVSVVGTNFVDFETMENWSVEPNQAIASNVKIQTTNTQWGGSSATCYFDKASEHNRTIFLNGLEMTIVDYVPPESSLLLGSYIFDPLGIIYKYLPSNIGTNLNTRILKGESGVIALVNSANEFGIDGGYVVFDYGTALEEGPVPYLALSGNQIVIDPSYTFNFSHKIGSTVRQVKQLSPVIPPANGLMYQPFLTGTSTARISFFELIKTVISAGVFITEDVLYPELRFSDESIKPYE